MNNEIVNLIFSILFSCLAVLAVAYLLFFVYKFIKVKISKQQENPVNQIHETGFVPKPVTPPVVYNRPAAANNPRPTGTAKLRTTEMIADNTDKIQIGTSTIIGTRKYQQDAVIVCNREFMKKNNFRKAIAVLCDGMGGMTGGEIASALATRTLFEDYIKTQPQDIPKFLKDEVDKVDEMVYSLKDENNNPLGSGSTMVSVVIENGNLYWVSVGDSRIYIIRDTEMVQVTTDHNYYSILKKKADSGLITYEEARNDPKAEALISFIGIGKESPIDNNEQPFPLQHGDIILLCSDGLYKTLSNEEIRTVILNNRNNTVATAEALTQTVTDKKKKGQDNTTVAVIKYLNQ